MACSPSRHSWRVLHGFAGLGTGVRGQLSEARGQAGHWWRGLGLLAAEVQPTDLVSALVSAIRTPDRIFGTGGALKILKEYIESFCLVLLVHGFLIVLSIIKRFFGPFPLEYIHAFRVMHINPQRFRSSPSADAGRSSKVGSVPAAQPPAAYIGSSRQHVRRSM